MKEHAIAVSVANLWTDPDAARPVDSPITTKPADPSRWVQKLSHTAKLELHENNLLQSQVLFGTTVKEEDEKDGWVKVVVPSQSTPKHIHGYPGWILAHQLAAPLPKSKQMVEVAAKHAVLILEGTAGSMELSFMTRLPFLGEDVAFYTVMTPIGRGRISKSESRILTARSASGGELIAAAESFIGLDYLWGGMSSWGYDCSGFAHNMHLAGGYTIPRDASAQVLSGKPVASAKAEPGDLLFFAHEQGKGRVHHVGFYHGDGKLLHAPKTGRKIEILDMTDTVYETELCAVRRYWS
ncbi:NlpC/P60 family protein [Terribacillus saccharophilus]|uniref:C40 family peptidase n=1 Tax=Terribacillus saccharophilus TaxID=361277 RepID=UPI0039829B31